MKKNILRLILLFCAIGITACGVGDRIQTDENADTLQEKREQGKTYEIAFMGDAKEVDDQTFYRNTWKEVIEYADENHISYSYYHPVKGTASSHEEAVKKAVKKGAKIIIAWSASYEEAICQLQNEYPKVQFLLLDRENNKQKTKNEIGKNVHGICFREEQAGCLAGYAAVAEGCLKLGFLGEKETPGIQRYGYGFIQGAEQAAEERGIQVELQYRYADSLKTPEEVEAQAEKWYEEGTKLIFSCGGEITESVIEAAEDENGRVIGTDGESFWDSSVVLALAVKDFNGAVINAIEALYDNGGVWTNEQAGKTITLGAAEESIALITEEPSWKFENFSKEDYKEVYEAIEKEEWNLSSSLTNVPRTNRVILSLQ